jgi:hypothetical protein
MGGNITIPTRPIKNQEITRTTRRMAYVVNPGWLSLARGIIWDLSARLSPSARSSAPRSPGIPKQTLVVIPDRRGSPFWSRAGTASKPAMMVVGDFQFTNVHTGVTSVAKAFLVVSHSRYLWLRPSRHAGHHGVQHEKTTLHTAYATIPLNGSPRGGCNGSFSRRSCRSVTASRARDPYRQIRKRAPAGSLTFEPR